jgi:hypothetical protein
MQFSKAVRKKSKLRLALTGPSGSGKTYGALLIAKGLGGKIAVIDTENGSASLYSDICEFDTLELVPPYSPERYISAIRAASDAGYDVLVIDSTTHEWSGSGGCLEINESTAQVKYRGNTWSAWNETTPRHRKFIDSMLQSSMHIIATGRSKTETSQEDTGNGKKKVVKLGMKTEQRDGFEYEFTCVLDIMHENHYAVASKDRTGIFGNQPLVINENVGTVLRKWLDSGVEPKKDTDPKDEIIQQEFYESTCERLSEFINEIKIGINKVDYARASYSWSSLSEEDKMTLWKAPSKGGCFTTEERTIMKSPEFRQAYQPAQA